MMKKQQSKSVSEYDFFFPYWCYFSEVSELQLIARRGVFLTNEQFDSHSTHFPVLIIKYVQIGDKLHEM